MLVNDVWVGTKIGNSDGTQLFTALQQQKLGQGVATNIFVWRSEELRKGESCEELRSILCLRIYIYIYVYIHTVYTHICIYYELTKGLF